MLFTFQIHPENGQMFNKHVDKFLINFYYKPLTYREKKTQIKTIAFQIIKNNHKRQNEKRERERKNKTKSFQFHKILI